MKLQALGLLFLGFIQSFADPDFQVIALYEIRTMLNDSRGVLNGWRNNQVSPCYFPSISCDQDQRIISITLSSSGLSGFLSSSMGKLLYLQHLLILIKRYYFVLSYILVLDYWMGPQRKYLNREYSNLFVHYLIIERYYYTNSNIKGSNNKRHLLNIAIFSPIVAFCILFCWALIRRHRKGKQILRESLKVRDEELFWGIEGADSDFKFFEVSQVVKATSNFFEQNKLGQGGFGPVYKGQFPDGMEIAVKRLASHSGQVIERIAEGLLYLHKHSRLRIIHRDVKASNILLDSEMNPKISDFGLAKMFSSNDAEGNTRRVVGTYGYMAPEYASEGLFSTKSDVFSFGVLILEIITGKRNSGFHQYEDFFNLLGYAWQSWKEGRWLQLVDPSLVTEHCALGIMRCTNIGLLCVQENAADRPSMSDVVAMLSSESMTLLEPKHPAYFHTRMTKEEVSTIIESYSINDVTISTPQGR
uniref:Protein kinase domain-containing protein n=1 Tax=Oryza punctata TaxID=4537 RepID=A0A0E0MH42_ORYPU